MTLDLLWKGPHIHISSVIFVMSMMLMNVCPYSFLNITVIAAHFHNFIFCFKFCYPVVDIIVNHLQYFSIHVKPIQNVVAKTKKPTVTSFWRS